MRILLAGVSSGCGKTTASLILMAALRQHGLTIAPYKAGPDYIDPGFHRVICSRPSHNLDTYLMEADTINRLLCCDADIAVIEGVMGYYDGLDIRTLRCSSWELARTTQTPVILVVDARGGAASVAAQVKGFMTLREDSGIAAVLVNRVSGERHYQLIREAIAHYTGLPCVGYLGRQAALELPSRHLGLIPVEETPDIAARVTEAAREAAKTLDLPMLLRIADMAPGNSCAPEKELPFHPLRLGVALDEAFHFYYEANLEYLRAMGMELCFFSPLRDTQLPKDLDGLYFGGGYPEVFARELEENRSMRKNIRTALEDGMRCYGECGGLLYLSHSLEGREMVGFLPVDCYMTKRLQRFGYVTVQDRTGLRFPAHEFHHALAQPRAQARCAYTVYKASDPQNTWQCGFERGGTLGAFAHAHWAGRPEMVRRFWG